MNEPTRSLAVVAVTFAAMLAAIGWGLELLLERRDHPNRDIEIGAGGPSAVVLEANPSGQYLVPGKINGTDVVFLVDTGATHVAVPERLASRMGLERGRDIPVQTAGGETRAASVMLDRVVIGGIERRNVRGLITASMSGDYVLLGMTFLRHLDLRKDEEQLILREGGS